jgi:hypothetical protein
MRMLERLTNVRRRLTDLSLMCFATSFAMVVVAGIGMLANQIGTSWPWTQLMAAAAGFYFMLGIAYFAQNLWQSRSNLSNSAATALEAEQSEDVGDVESEYVNHFASEMMDGSAQRNEAEIGAGV